LLLVKIHGRDRERTALSAFEKAPQVRFIQTDARRKQVCRMAEAMLLFAMQILDRNSLTATEPVQERQEPFVRA
jgi:hypothetical protein